MKNYLLLLAVLPIMGACNSASTSTTSSTMKDSSTKVEITTLDVVYAVDSVKPKSTIAYDPSIQGKRPVVLVIPEWWGLGDYIKMRTRELAKLGYFAMGVDMYGDAMYASNPDDAGKAAMPFYKDPNLVKSRLSAAMDQLKKYPQADINRVAMIGYCFGGSMSLKAAKMGLPLKAVVSFHGNLADNASKTVPILICHGAADQFVKPEEVAAFRKSMDSLGANYIFKSYPGATHAFTNPNATETGKKFHMPIEYNAAADTASWNEMKTFLTKNL